MAQRRGGLARASDARAVKLWTRAGRQMHPTDLPATLLGMVEAVASGDLEPSQATAIATLMRTALAVDVHLGWQHRLNELEDLVRKLNGNEGPR